MSSAERRNFVFYGGFEFALEYRGIDEQVVCLPVFGCSESIPPGSLGNERVAVLPGCSFFSCAYVLHKICPLKMLFISYLVIQYTKFPKQYNADLKTGLLFRIPVSPVHIFCA